jgi:hypothetical protein
MMGGDIFLFHAFKIYYGISVFLWCFICETAFTEMDCTFLFIFSHVTKYYPVLQTPPSYFHMLQNITLFYRLLVAASVGQNTQGDSLILRHTTLMPNLHGLASLICLIFAPCVELRYRTFLITFHFTCWILLFCSITSRKNSFKGQNSFLYLRKAHVFWILQISQVMK